MRMAIQFIRGLISSPVGSFITQIFQIGVVSTLWLFVGNIVKTMQRNVINLASTTLTAA